MHRYKKLILFKLFIISLFCLANKSEAATLYMGPNEAYTNLQAAMAAMQGGDTLIIRDGTYTGSSNMININNYPPYGTAEDYTIIKAEHDGSVLFDGEGVRDTFSINPGMPTDMYYQFEGILWGRSSSVVVNLVNSRYVKFLRCGGFDAGNGNTTIFNANRYCDYILFESCYAWGSGRVAIAAYQSDHIIFRNCVARIDRVSCSDPVYTFGMYSVDHGLVQNCIAIDNDQNAHYLNDMDGQIHDWSGGFAVPSTDMDANDITFDQCVVLNSHIGGIFTSGNNFHAYDTTFRNCVIWDVSSRTDQQVNLNLFKGIRNVIDHCTFGVGASNYLNINGWNGGDSSTTFTHNIVTGQTGSAGCLGVLCNVVDDNSVYYNNGSPLFVSGGGCSGNINQNSTTNINPIWNTSNNPNGGLKYITQIETGSTISGKGANVKTLLGFPGTFWGETGYDTDTGISMWPFPNEDLIKTKMAAYTDEGVNGARGFAASGNGLYGGPITLTSYIWEYLGNPCPADICNYNADENVPSFPSGLSVN